MPKRLPATPPVLPGLAYVRPLGSGGFADVFLYEQDMPRRAVAVKVLPSDVRDPGLLRMFNSEADVLAHLSAHPSIVTVYQAGISADGRAYIVMEYCPGSLAQRYRRERLPVDEVLVIGVRMASALESAHRAGLVHRDVKPSNILITSFGVPVLADFGISAALTPTHGDEILAMSVPWSAPEVIAEQTPGTVASEIWSLGATVYSLLAGHSPFERPEAGQNSREQLRRRIQHAAYPRITRPDVPDELQAALARALARDPVDRYATALAFAEALQEVQRGLGLAQTPVEVAVDEWAPQAEAVDFADAAPRAMRSNVEHTTSRRTSEPAALASQARDEDSTTMAPASRRRAVWPWALGAGIASALAVGIAWWLQAVG
jgi:serine/threonine protein kinase